VAGTDTGKTALPQQDSRKRVVIGVIGHDIHAVANRVLAVVLEDAGFFVCNLRTNNTIGDFVDAVLEVEADAVLMSSLNGEGENWCSGFRARMVEEGFGDILLYIGGNLVVGEADESVVVNRFQSWGFDRVFYGAADLNQVISLLQEDLAHGVPA
jgi:methylaspartate mutase sigma subunit